MVKPPEWRGPQSQPPLRFYTISDHIVPSQAFDGFPVQIYMPDLQPPGAEPPSDVVARLGEMIPPPKPCPWKSAFGASESRVLKEYATGQRSAEELRKTCWSSHRWSGLVAMSTFPTWGLQVRLVPQVADSRWESAYSGARIREWLRRYTMMGSVNEVYIYPDYPSNLLLVGSSDFHTVRD